MSIRIENGPSSSTASRHSITSAWTFRTANCLPARPVGSGRPRYCESSRGLSFPTKGGSRLRQRRDSATRSRARVGFVFQHYALFRHMTVFENVAFGLRVEAGRTATFAIACWNCYRW